MKKSILYIGLLLLGVVMFSCNKQSFDYPEGTVGISKITQYPEFTLNGPQYVSIVKGSTYTDAGATAKEGSNDLKVTTTGSVNTNVVGVYNINYSATNKDGFEGSTSRTVIVLPSADAGIDISGKYYYATNSSLVATMTKITTGYYQVSNFFSASSIIPAYLICSDGTNIIIPLQSTGYGRLEGTAVLSGTTSGSTLHYIVSLLDQSAAYQNLPRNWVKQ